MESLEQGHESSRETASRELKPADGGRSTGLVLLTSFTFEALFWGFPTSFGVFQDYYTNHPNFESNTHIQLIGALGQSLMFLGAPLSAIATKKFHRYQPQQLWLGWGLCILGLLSASFASSNNALIATQGVLYGIGVVTLTYPNISMLSEWWVARKGMAFGLISAASGAVSVVLPFILEVLLRKYGYRTTLRASAVAMLVLSGPLLPFIKGRLPPAERSVLARTNWSFLSRPLFWVYASATLVQGFGFFIPPVFLPSFATATGFSPLQGAVLLRIMSVAKVIGQFAVGYLSDGKVPVGLLTSSCCFGAAFAAYVFWGLGHTVTLLVIFSMVYGFCGFGFGTLRVAMGRAVSDDGSAMVAMYSMFVFLQGVGLASTGPISATLLAGDVHKHKYGSDRFKGLVFATGGASLVACLIITISKGFTSLRRTFLLT